MENQSTSNANNVFHPQVNKGFSLCSFLCSYIVFFDASNFFIIWLFSVIGHFLLVVESFLIELPSLALFYPLFLQSIKASIYFR